MKLIAPSVPLSAGFVAAQSSIITSSPPAATSTMSGCIIVCANTAGEAVGCYGAGDLLCLCAIPRFQEEAETCVKGAQLRIKKRPGAYNEIYANATVSSSSLAPTETYGVTRPTSIVPESTRTKLSTFGPEDTGLPTFSASAASTSLSSSSTISFTSNPPLAIGVWVICSIGGALIAMLSI